MTSQEMQEKIEEFENNGWKYLHDGQDWTSGSWYNEQLGSVNLQGGSFKWIGQAVEALEVFLKSLELCNQ
jgi:hypothetical protein